MLESQQILLAEMLTGSLCLREVTFSHQQLFAAAGSCTSAPPDSRQPDYIQVQCVFCLLSRCHPLSCSLWQRFRPVAAHAVSSAQSASFLPWPRHRHARHTQVPSPFLPRLFLLPVPTLTLFSCPACQDALPGPSFDVFGGTSSQRLRSG